MNESECVCVRAHALQAINGIQAYFILDKNLKVCIECQHNKYIKCNVRMEFHLSLSTVHHVPTWNASSVPAYAIPPHTMECDDNPSFCNQLHWLKHKITSWISSKMVCCSSDSDSNGKNWTHTTPLFFLDFNKERRYGYWVHTITNERNRVPSHHKGFGRRWVFPLIFSNKQGELIMCIIYWNMT
jgi:hypothetical protein